ncbi:beta-1,6-N-acetylglucosaminyltransferase [Carnobacterium viridans]|uniref:Peptide O-xylosyltransferase n=1 Tax=Carnobacterium viridans TaxID=174587 RepID=A0A1H0YFZ9_9LACT|nr:beta-1,6-N-acetylglucosaminyltransferase [Carnobacterium viridans]UDE95159.1 beta-1,6-N-acetylglucosaminyltransferase [Carnobacterium viridans]SDQ13960.1 Core-2/I-Branching enzyme [Carnobacterium viridans]
MTLNKHAYLIIAHNEFELLENLVEVLDDERNDIYIHIDLKSKIDENFKKKFVGCKSAVYFIERTTINWGGFSQIQCEINLLKAATEKTYAYYHLLSGVDFPLKNQDEIHDFFEKNMGKEFIHFNEKDIQKNILARVKFYYLIQDSSFFTKNKITGMLRNKTNHFFNKFQKLMGIDRMRNSNVTYMKGANWFSITNDFAEYTVSQEKWISKIFRNTLCGDEFFLQTLLYNSQFKENLYSKEFNDNYLSIMRYIDWEKGNPYTWRTEDFNRLKNSPYLFARKFSLKIDNELIYHLKESILCTRK